MPLLWMGSVVIDRTNFPRMLGFWQAALGYVPRDPLDAEGVVLKDPAGVGPILPFYRTDEAPLNEYLLHLDLCSSDPEKEVGRLSRLGATV